MSRLDVAEPQLAEARSDVQPVAVTVVVDAALGASAGGRERLEHREVVALGELVDGELGGDDALAFVAAGENRARLAERGSFGARVEPAGSLPAVDVTEHHFEHVGAGGGAAAVDVRRDALTRARAVGRFVVHGSSTSLCQGRGR